MNIEEFDYEILKANNKFKERFEGIKAITKSKLSSFGDIPENTIEVCGDGIGDIAGKELSAGTLYLRPEIVVKWNSCKAQSASDALAFAKVLAEVSQMAIDYNLYRRKQVLRLRGLAQHIIQEQ